MTAMQAQYATSNELALQKFAIQQLLASAPGPFTRADWAVLTIVAVHSHVMHTGDLTIAAEQFDFLLKNQSRLETISDVTGLSEGTESLVDWPPGMRDGWQDSATNTISSAWIYYGATTLASIATLIGRDSDAAHLLKVAADLKAAMNAKQWNDAGAFCDGVCTNTSHMAFHSTMYSLAFGAVSEEHVDKAWAYVRHRSMSGIDPPFSATQTNPEESDATSLPVSPQPAPESSAHLPPSASANPHPTSWPPPGPTSGLGMPCSVHPAQFTLIALYENAADKGAAALKVMTSDVKHSWLAMLKKG